MFRDCVFFFRRTKKRKTSCIRRSCLDNYEFYACVTYYEMQIMSLEIWVTKLWIMSYELWVTNYELRIMIYELWITNYDLRITNYELLIIISQRFIHVNIANYEFHAHFKALIDLSKKKTQAQHSSQSHSSHSSSFRRHLHFLRFDSFDSSFRRAIMSHIQTFQRHMMLSNDSKSLNVCHWTRVHDRVANCWESENDKKRSNSSWFRERRERSHLTTYREREERSHSTTYERKEEKSHLTTLSSFADRHNEWLEIRVVYALTSELEFDDDDCIFDQFRKTWKRIVYESLRRLHFVFFEL